MRWRSKCCLFVAAIVVCSPSSYLTHGINISWKHVRPPKLTIELVWSKIIEHHYHNATTASTAAANEATPIPPMPFPSQHPYASESTTSFPLFDNFGSGPPPPSRSRRMEERLDDDALESATRKVLDRSKSKTVYLQVDIIHHHKNSGTRQGVSNAGMCLFIFLSIWSLISSF